MYEDLIIDLKKRREFTYTYSYHKCTIEVYNVDNQPWYDLNDVVAALDICPDPVVLDRCENIRKIYNGRLVIPESDVLNIINMLYVPHKEDFRKWIVEEVSPAIRNWDELVRKEKELEKREHEKQIARMKEARRERDNEILWHWTIPKIIIHEIEMFLKRL